MDKRCKAFLYAVILKLGINAFPLCLAGRYAYLRILTPIMVIQVDRSLDTEYICLC